MKKLLTMILLTYGMLVSAQTAVFVSADGNDSNNGSSWGAAKKTIAAGITAAGGNGTVYVKAGEYAITAQIVIPAGVSVKGGYGLASSGTDTTRRELPGTNSRWENASICTIITGNGSHRIASVSGLLEGCILRRGYTNATGGGVYIDGGTVRYCVIRECDAIDESTLAAEGGGAYILNDGILSNSVITECRGDKGPAVSGGNGTLVNNTITRNWPTHCGTVADYDGNVYSTVVIGQQCWTKQNLRTTHYNDGTAIPKGNSNSSTEPRYCINYNAITSTMLTNYGYLYNWPAVMHGAPSSNENPSGVTGICPPGWHVPSLAEWTELTNFVNSIARYRCSGYDWQIAKSLSSKSGWTSSNTSCQVGNNQGGNNATLFTAYPAGCCNFIDIGFEELGQDAKIWCTTEKNDETTAWFYEIRNNSSNINYLDGGKYVYRSVRCVKQLSNEPMVHTNEIYDSAIHATHVSCSGNCHSVDENAITAYGICWGTSPNPTIEGSHTEVGSGSSGGFTTTITGLSNGVTYYVRAYVVCPSGTYYGEERTVTTNDCNDSQLTDYDGNTYNAVLIGNQCWMKENLRTTRYADGTLIQLLTGSTSSTTEAYRYYPGNSSSYVAQRGYLYNWTAAMHGASSSNTNPSNVQGVCPNGWHLPSRSEWGQMLDYVGSKSYYRCGSDPKAISKALAGKSGWSNYNTTECDTGYDLSTNNATGFSALNAGYHYQGTGGFDYYALFWTSTNSDAYMIQRSSSIYYLEQQHTPARAHSVRCIRDEQ